MPGLPEYEASNPQSAAPPSRRWQNPAILVPLLAFVFLFILAGRASATEHDSQSAAQKPGITDEAMGRAHDQIETAKADMAAGFETAESRLDSVMTGVHARTDPLPGSGLVEGNQRESEHGTLYLLKSSPNAPATFTGRGGYSADGTSGPAGVLSADVPAGSTVEQAYLYAYFQTGTPTVTDSVVNFDGTPVSLAKLDDYASMTLSSGRADVTPQVAAQVGPGTGISNFAVPSTLPVDGLALVVVYSNPALPERTIAIFDGAAQTLGDTATFSFVVPLDKSDPGFSARMSLGIGFSFQQASGHLCGPGSPVSKQHSTVDVNGARLTSCAGGSDDATTFGSLITVGGIGDSTDNPADPFQTPADGNPVRVTDDEYYDLEPFLNQGDTSLVVTTSQPSNDDILFLSIIQVDGLARVSTELCADGRDGDGDGLTDELDPDCPEVVEIVPPGTEICDDGLDNDGDGFVDLLDSECPLAVTPPPVTPVVVGVGVSPFREADIPADGAKMSVAKPGSGAAVLSPRTLPRTGENTRLLLQAALALILIGWVIDRWGSRPRRPGTT